jgi:hypothetical protein
MEDAGRTVGRFDELTRTHPYLPKRVTALRLFADTTYFKSFIAKPGDGPAAGTSKEACDARVAELLTVLR